MSYRLSDRGVALIKEFEGFRNKAYKDVAGVWTIGYGSTRIGGKPVVSGQTITEPEATAALRTDVQDIEATLTRLKLPSLTQNQVDALIDFCYNLGVGAFMRSSLRTAIATKQPITASLFTRWNKARDPKTGALVTVAGLTRRRQAEYQLYVSK